MEGHEPRKWLTLDLQYGLFLDPVSEEDYPGYWQAIGGQDKAMDLGTMERKVDDREYKSLEDFEVSIRPDDSSTRD